MTSRIDNTWTTSPTGQLVKVTTKKRGRFPVSDRERRTVDGVTFDSLKEAGRYIELKRMEQAKLIECLELQPAWHVTINGQPYCRFSADFSYIDLRTNRPVIEDVKSSGSEKDAAYRLRKKAAELFHGIKVTEVVR